MIMAACAPTAAAGAAMTSGALSDPYSGKAPADPKKACTVFVRNLPFNCTNEMLQEAFADIGPVKRAFVIPAEGKELVSVPQCCYGDRP